MSDKQSAFKLEVNVPVWLEIVPHETYGFNPYQKENEAKEIIQGGKKKKIPASTSWMFGVITPKGTPTVWWANRENVKNAVSEMAQNETLNAGGNARIAMMQFVVDKKYYLCLYAATSGYRVMPDREIPERFIEFCKVAPTLGAPAQKATTAFPASKSEAPQANGKLDWVTAGEAMQNALTVAKNAWNLILEQAFAMQMEAEESCDQVQLTKAMELYRVAKEAAAHGLPATAHTIFIEVVRAGRGR